MAKLKSFGAFDESALSKAREALSQEAELNFGEGREPSKRSGAGYPSIGNFTEQHFDFARCQRADGSYYGTGGTCRMGTDAGAKEKQASGGGAKGGSAGKVKDQKDPRAAAAAAKREIVAKEVKPARDAAKAAGAREKDLNQQANRAETALKMAAKQAKANPTPENKARVTEARAQLRQADKAARAATKDAAQKQKALEQAARKAEKAGMTPAQRKENNRIRSLIKQFG